MACKNPGRLCSDFFSAHEFLPYLYTAESIWFSFAERAQSSSSSPRVLSSKPRVELAPFPCRPIAWPLCAKFLCAGRPRWVRDPARLQLCQRPARFLLHRSFPELVAMAVPLPLLVGRCGLGRRPLSSISRLPAAPASSTPLAASLLDFQYQLVYRSSVHRRSGSRVLGVLAPSGHHIALRSPSFPTSCLAADLPHLLRVWP
jgi:hypothetical protein